jgi:hypothetical protein
MGWSAAWILWSGEVYSADDQLMVVEAGVLTGSAHVTGTARFSTNQTEVGQRLPSARNTTLLPGQARTG